jgi:hypothetical protein
MCGYYDPCITTTCHDTHAGSSARQRMLDTETDRLQIPVPLPTEPRSHRILTWARPTRNDDASLRQVTKPLAEWI